VDRNRPAVENRLKGDAEGRPTAERGIDIDLRVVVRDDAVDDRKPEAAALSERAAKRLKTAGNCPRLAASRPSVITDDGLDRPVVQVW